MFPQALSSQLVSSFPPNMRHCMSDNVYGQRLPSRWSCWTLDQLLSLKRNTFSSAGDAVGPGMGLFRRQAVRAATTQQFQLWVLATAGSDATVMQGNKQLLLSSPAFTKEKFPQHAPILETPTRCCWGYSRAKKFPSWLCLRHRKG